MSINVCTCQTCQDEPEFTMVEFFDHAQSVHGIDLKTTKGQRQMTTHMDAREWHQTNYCWTFGNLTFTQVVRMERAADDMMRFV